MYQALQFLGIDTRLVLGLVAQDASVNTADLDFTVLGVMSAMGTLPPEQFLAKKSYQKVSLTKKKHTKKKVPK